MISKIKNFLLLSFLIGIAGLATIIFTVTLIYPTLPDVESLSKSNRDLLSENGIVIYLKSNQKDLIKRMKNDKTRPLLKNGNIEEIIKKLCKEREPLYEEIADFEIITKNKRIHEVINEIIRVIN